MSQSEKVRLGDVLFQGIDENDYLNELYKNILYNYAITTLRITNIKQLRGINVDDALRFADLLSKSTHPEKSDAHKIWAHEIITMLLALYPEDEVVRYYAGAVLTNTGNFMGKKLVESAYTEPTAMDELFSTLSDIYLTVPAEPDKKFFQQQRHVYEHLDDECFSYSAPTSMGKSFIMRMFIKAQILAGARKNFALIVPTKALINEVRSEIIKKDLQDLLDEKQYHVVSSANDMALETHSDHNFIFVLTPERLLYLLNDKSDFVLDYLFVDEAHKMTGRNSRAPFYYSVIDELTRKNNRPHFIFASPSIPNPQEYLRLLASGEYNQQNAVASSFSPVAQFKFLVNLKTRQIYIYNDHLKTPEYICSINSSPDDGVIPLMGLMYKERRGISSRMIAYFNSKDKAINAALAFAKIKRQIDGDNAPQPTPELVELARDVRNQVHRDYFLASLLEQGIAYHIGYLPSAIRMQIEKLFKEEKITAMFCTSTLVEGVNLPADNLFITSYYSGRAQMTDVDFRNLIGRVGRIQYNLSGNVFMISDETRNNKQDVYLDRLKGGIPDQHLSLVQDLKPKHKKKILETLLGGSSVIDKYNKDQPEEEYIMMRKFGLILLKDIMHGNDSLVVQEFEQYMADGDKERIRDAFSQHSAIIDNDINISLDQTRRLRAAIAADSTFAYPMPESDGSFNIDKVLDFLIRLGEIFDWKRYEFSTLGKCDEDGDYTKLRWYSVILVQWMEGKGLNYIMRRAVEYQERHPEKFWINRYTKMYYDKTSLEHRNIVFANTLEVIENIILFSISNYFLRFSNEYKRVHGENSLNSNNWYEYVEYGTTNTVTIQLQRYGFSRESATYIKAHSQYFTVDEDGNVRVKNDLENCGDNEVAQQIPDIRFNTPELFID